MRTLLICHDDAALDKIGLARWLASFSTLTGIVSIREPRKRTRQRVRREIKRVGLLRFTDVLAFRVYYGLFLASRDRDWETKTLGGLCEQYPPVDVPTLITTSPNSTE